MDNIKMKMKVYIMFMYLRSNNLPGEAIYRNFGIFLYKSTILNLRARLCVVHLVQQNINGG